MNQDLTVQLPSEIYVRIKKRAAESQRTVEAEAAELLAAMVPATGFLSDALAESLAALALLDNPDLERAAKTPLPAALAEDLEALHIKQQREGLTEVESVRSAHLSRAYEQSMLIRAQAAAILKSRGIVK
jgi:plasmid stability protein